MKILMVHPHDLWYDPWTIRILELARGLKRRGHEVRLCHLPRKEKPSYPPIRLQEASDPEVFDLLPRQHQIISNYRLLKRLAEDSDILHLQKCFASVTLPLLWISRSLNKPLHYDWDDNETAISQCVEKRFLSRWQLAAFENNLPHFADTLSYSSQALKEKALALGYPDDRLFHLPVGADTERFHPQKQSKEILQSLSIDPSQLVILYLGQMEGAAHAHRLIDAAPIIRAQHPSSQFLFAGGGEQLEALRSHAEASSARAAIHILGYIPYQCIPALVGAADICVACFDDSEASRAKSPLKIAEYMAAGKAIVATGVGETPWMLEKCGLLVEPHLPLELADAILRYAASPEDRITDGQKARLRALKYFTWDRGVDTLIRAYSRIRTSHQPLPSS